MPLYEYKCRSCGEVFEVMQRFSDKPLEVHDGCGGALERLLSPPAFHFKGSGWYITDYARKGEGKADGKTADSKSSASSSCCASSATDGKSGTSPDK